LTIRVLSGLSEGKASATPLASSSARAIEVNSRTILGIPLHPSFLVRRRKNGVRLPPPNVTGLIIDYRSFYATPLVSQAVAGRRDRSPVPPASSRHPSNPAGVINNSVQAGLVVAFLQECIVLLGIWRTDPAFAVKVPSPSRTSSSPSRKK
jgi:hypothetical protein